MRLLHLNIMPAVTAVRFDPEEYAVVEGEAAHLRIILTEPSTMEVTVMLSTQDGTASGEEHFSLVAVNRWNFA